MKGCGIKICLFAFWTAYSITTVSAVPLDSIRTETKEGQQFVIHQVEAGETLFSLSKRYGSSVNAIKEANPMLSEGLKIDQEIWIPLAIDKKDQISNSEGTHMVDVGETLYAISRQYEVSLEELREWNNLPDNNIDVGQILVVKDPGTITASTAVVVTETVKTDSAAAEVVEPEIIGNAYHIVGEGETLFSISQRYAITLDQLKSWNNLASNYISPGQRLAISENATTSAIDSLSSDEAPNRLADEAVAAAPAVEMVEMGSRRVTEGGFEKIYEKGLAAVIAKDVETKKYLALHRDAPKGTILQVKNLMNDITLFVRVVGALPDTGDNDKILLKLSRPAYERLGALDPRFPVEVSYIP